MRSLRLADARNTLSLVDTETDDWRRNEGTTVRDRDVRSRVTCCHPWWSTTYHRSWTDVGERETHATQAVGLHQTDSCTPPSSKRCARLCREHQSGALHERGCSQHCGGSRARHPEACKNAQLYDADRDVGGSIRVVGTARLDLRPNTQHASVASRREASALNGKQRPLTATQHHTTRARM